MSALAPVPQTIDGLFRARVAQSPDARAYSDRGPNGWRHFTWTEAARTVARVRAGLLKSGVQPGDRIGVCAYNSPEWIFCDIAALSLGLTVVPLFFNDRPENTAYCLRDAGVQIVFVDRPVAPEILASGVRGIVALKEVAGVVSLAHWMPEDGDETPPGHDAATLATIVYTSGTTGRPKGVMLTHANITSNVAALLDAIPEVAARDHTFLSFLPLSHMLERTVGGYTAMAIGAHTVFSRGISELAADLRAARPTVLVSVPKVFERSYARMKEEAAASPVRARALGWAQALGYAAYEGRARGLKRIAAGFADLLVARAVRRKLGGRLSYVFMGGAAVSPALLKAFTGLGLRFVQGYGLTETSPVITCNRLADHDLESVGRPLAGLALAFPEGEVCVKGASVMAGYWRNPEATAQVIDGEGYFHTGDLGHLRDGRLYLTGRAKDVIVLSNGEKVAPGDVEQAILEDPVFEQAIVVGEGRGALALVAVSPLADLEDLQARANARLHAFPGYTRIRYVLRVAGPWTVENGLLTPTMKVRRQEVEARYREAIEDLYAQPAHH